MFLMKIIIQNGISSVRTAIPTFLHRAPRASVPSLNPLVPYLSPSIE